MNDVVAEIFGYVVLAIAVSLAAWELYVYNRPDEDVTWLQTPGRLKRRIIMAAILACVGTLILCEGLGLLSLDNLKHLAIYVVSLTGLALVLFILSVRDLGDMARSAERQAIRELQSAINDQEITADKPPGPTE